MLFDDIIFRGKYRSRVCAYPLPEISIPGVRLPLAGNIDPGRAPGRGNRSRDDIRRQRCRCAFMMFPNSAADAPSRCFRIQLPIALGDFANDLRVTVTPIGGGGNQLAQRAFAVLGFFCRAADKKLRLARVHH